MIFLYQALVCIHGIIAGKATPAVQAMGVGNEIEFRRVDQTQLASVSDGSNLRNQMVKPNRNRGGNMVQNLYTAYGGSS